MFRFRIDRPNSLDFDSSILGSNPRTGARKKYMKQIKCIERISDGLKFVLNDNGTYSLETLLEFKKSGYFVREFAIGRLLQEFPGEFKIVIP